MKIGFSFGRCVRDIVKGDVELHDVLLINARTRMETVQQVEGVVDAYMYRPDYLMGLDRDVCINVATRLFESGRIHQPRLVNVNPFQVDNEHIWMDLAPTANADNEVVQVAWRNYQMALKLVSENQPTADSRYM